MQNEDELNKRIRNNLEKSSMLHSLSKNYQRIITDLKEKIRQARLRSAVTVNAQLLVLYWDIGNTIFQQEQSEGWGAKIVETLAKDLQSEFPDMKGLSLRNLRYMREFAVAYPHFPIVQAPLAQLPNASSEKTEHAILQVPLAKLQPPVAKINSTVIVQPPIAQISWYHARTIKRDDNG